MSSHIESNLSLLAARQPELARILRSTCARNIKLFPSHSGLPTASRERGSGPIFFHSRYDPMREARQKLKEQQYAGADYYIFLGFGLGYLLDALLEESRDPSNHYFIIESDLEIIRAALEARDLSSVLSRSNLHFAWPNSGPELAEQWFRFFDPVHAQGSAYFTWLPSAALNPELFKAAAEVIQSQTFQIFTDINTLVAKSEAFLENFVKNLPAAAGSPGVSGFSGAFSGVPAVIVSAGPSLDKNIHELRGWEDKVLIISTDTALKPLLSAGIDPHFVMTCDPSLTNYNHLREAGSRLAFLVFEATSYPSSAAEFEGKTISCIFENSALSSIAELLADRGRLRAWGSVATMALDFALQLRCDPVIFIGQDLAHTDGRLYCTGTCFDDDWFASVHDPDSWQRKLQGLRASRRTVMAEDIFGRPIETTDKLLSYWNWLVKEISRHPEVRFVNATEGGILREGASIMSLKEALYRHCSTDRALRGKIRALYEQEKAQCAGQAILDPFPLIRELSSIKDILQQALQICRSTENAAAGNPVMQLESAKKSIYLNRRLAPLLDAFNQMGNITFLRKQRALFGSDGNRPTASQVIEAYAQYFDSVAEALARIEPALTAIAQMSEKKWASPVPPPGSASTETAIPSITQ